jgi:hypothetical protein
MHDTVSSRCHLPIHDTTPVGFRRSPTYRREYPTTSLVHRNNGALSCQVSSPLSQLYLLPIIYQYSICLNQYPTVIRFLHPNL